MMMPSNTPEWAKELIQTSEDQLNAVLRAERRVFDLADEVRAGKEQWDMAYEDFVLKEGSIDPPGGGRWNEAKRLAYVKQTNERIWLALQKAEQDLIEAEFDLKAMKYRISHTNRILRILEITHFSVSEN